MEIIKSLNGKPGTEIAGASLKMFVDWEKLQPSIEKSVMLKPDEVVEGYVVTEAGINVTIGRKKGRKVGSDDTI